MKKHIRAFYTSLFTVFCVCFILACQNPFDSPDIGEGTFSLVIGNAGRTILPTTVQSNFAGYTLVFSSNGKANVSVERTNTTLANSITLSAATWNLTVTAYTDSGKTKPAAQGSIDGIVIDAGANVSRSLELKPIVESGAKGTFSWNIGYPTEVTVASMKITPLDSSSGTPEQTLYFTGGTPSVSKNNSSSPLSLNTGYYQVMFSLSNGQHNIGREEYLHVYKNMDSRFEYTFTQDHFTIYSVTNGNDSGPGSLRHAIANAANNSTILVESSVGTIQLTSRVNITKSFVLEGNGVKIEAPSWSNDNIVLYFYNDPTVTIRRVRFDNMQARIIYNYEGDLSLESCIFSNNNSTTDTIILNKGTMSVKGSTFYKNSGKFGGAISMDGGSVTLTGNLFYGNTSEYYNPIVYKYAGPATSSGYNVADVLFGTGFGQSGWVGQTTDKTTSSIPISPLNLKLLSGSEAANVISSIPAGYPAVDFYGNPIPTTSAAAGAVQTTITSGYFVEVSVNNSALGSAAMTAPALNSDGLYPAGGSIMFEATPEAGYELQYWLVNNQHYTDNPLILSLTSNYKVQAVFDRAGIDLVLLENANYRDFAIEAKLDAAQWSSVTSRSEFQQVLRQISKKVYAKFKDDFDFIFFILNTNEDSTITNALGFMGVNVPVSNNIKGLGKSISDNTPSYGSAGKLKSVMYFPFSTAIELGPALHEIAHNWAAYICPTSYESHWGVSNAGGQLGGFKYVRTVSPFDGTTTEYQGSMYPETNTDGSYKKGFGEYANGGNGIKYSDIELYLMGMIGAQELRDKNFHLDIYTGLSSSDKNSDAEKRYGYFKATGITSYTIDDLIARNGPRVPDVNGSQKDFKVLTVILSGSQDTAASTRYDDIVKGLKWFAGGPKTGSGYLVYNFNEATGGIGSLEVDRITNSLKGAW